MMQHRGLAAGLTLLALLAGGLVWHGTEGSSIVRTVELNAVQMAVDDRAGTVVVAGNGAAGGRVTVLDARTGAILHTIATRGSVSPGGEFAPPSLLALDEPAQRAYLTTPGYGAGPTSKGLLSVVDTLHGTVVRSVVLAPPPVVLAVDRRAGRAFVVGATNATMSLNRNGGRVTVLDARSGALVRVVSLHEDAGSVAVDEQAGRAFVTAQRRDKNGMPLGAGAMIVLDSASGRVLRRVAIGQNPYQIAVDERHHHVFSLGQPEQTPNAIGRVTMLDARSGAVLRTFTVGSIPTTLVMDALAGRLLTVNVGASPSLGGVSVLDTRNGALVQTISLRDTPQAVALAALDTPHGRRERLFIAAEDNNGRTCATGPSRLLMIDVPAHSGRARARNGPIVRSVPLGQGLRGVDVDVRHGRVFVVTAGDADPMRGCIPTGHGAVSVLDARSGRVLHVVPVGVNPMGIAVDERLGRAFILNAGGDMSVRPRDRWAWLPAWLRLRLPFIPGPPRGARVQVAPSSLTLLDTTQ